jgi:hypothetical protein
MNPTKEATVVLAAKALGWMGDPVRVRMCGESAWAIAAFSADADGGATITGVLVAGAPETNPTARASVFAGFCPRAVLVSDGPGVLSVQMDAAVLDQGVVVVRHDGRVDVLSMAGPRVTQPGTGETGYRRLVEQAHDGLMSAVAGERVD